jgi:hypothetical protein
MLIRELQIDSNNEFAGRLLCREKPTAILPFAHDHVFSVHEEGLFTDVTLVLRAVLQ